MMHQETLPKLKIEILSDESTAERIFYLLKQIDPSNAKRFVFDISLDLAEEIEKTDEFDSLKNKLIEFVSKNSDKNLPEKIKVLQEIWDKKNDNYFKQMETFFETKIKTPLFIGYATNLMVGNYGRTNDFVIRLKDNNLDQAIYIILEEILHLIYWDFWKKTFNTQEENPRSVKKDTGKLLSNWEISELIPEYAFYPEKSSGREKSYPWITSIRKIVDPLWKNKTNFKDFLIQLHNLKVSS